MGSLKPEAFVYRPSQTTPDSCSSPAPVAVIFAPVMVTKSLQVQTDLSPDSFERHSVPAPSFTQPGPPPAAPLHVPHHPPVNLCASITMPKASYQRWSGEISAESDKKFPEDFSLSRTQVQDWAAPLTSSRRGSILAKISLIAVVITQSAGVIGFLVSVYVSLDDEVDLSQDGGYRTILAYIVRLSLAHSSLFALYLLTFNSWNFWHLVLLCICSADL